MKPPIQFRPAKANKRSSPSKATKAKTKSKPGNRNPAPNLGLPDELFQDKAIYKVGGVTILNRDVIRKEKEHATVGSRRVVASGQNPKGTPLKKTGDEVSVAAVTHGQSSEPQQLLKAYKELERAKVRERVKRHRAKKKTK